MAIKFEVQEWTLCDGWINNWSDEDGNPSMFNSQHEAWQEWEAFYLDMHDAYTNGYLEDVPEKGNYRIVEVHHAPIN